MRAFGVLIVTTLLLGCASVGSSVPRPAAPRKSQYDQGLVDRFLDRIGVLECRSFFDETRGKYLPVSLQPLHYRDNRLRVKCLPTSPGGPTRADRGAVHQEGLRPSVLDPPFDILAADQEPEPEVSLDCGPKQVQVKVDGVMLNGVSRTLFQGILPEVPSPSPVPGDEGLLPYYIQLPMNTPALVVIHLNCAGAAVHAHLQ